MNKRAEPASKNKSPAALHSSPKLNSTRRASSNFADNRPEASALSRLQELANQSEHVGQLKALQQLANQSEHVGQLKALQQLANDRQQLSRLRALQHLANSSPQAKQAAQLRTLAKPNSPAPIQQNLDQGIAQLTQGPEPEEEELIQAKFETVQRQPNESDAKPRVNNTGLPDQLKAGIESLSGLELDHVRVHYNSAQPAQLNALAYAQGSDIHLAPGQEQHLPHEAWHIVQQAQGRVRPTLQLKDGVPVNDDAELEREADVMGARAVQMSRNAELLSYSQLISGQPGGNSVALQLAGINPASGVVQMEYPYGSADTTPHVHTYGADSHLKIYHRGRVRRYNIVQNGQVHAQAAEALEVAAGNDVLVAVIQGLIDAAE
jgi:hypothetical protein